MYMVLAKSSTEKTQVLYGQHDVLEKWKQCAFDTRKESNIYADSGSSLETFGFKNYLEILNYLKQKGIQIRYITEISKTNLQFCKLLMGIIPEFRHLDGIRGAFGVTDDEFLAPPPCKRSSLSPTQFTVMQNNWSKSNGIFLRHCGTGLLQSNAS